MQQESEELTPEISSSSAGRRFLQFIVPPLATFVLFLIGWQAATLVFDIAPYLLPGPGAVARAGLEHSFDLLSAAVLTAAGALGGFLLSVLGGVSIALLFSQSRLIERSLYPYALFLQTVPVVAIAPLIILWFGTGFQSVVLIAFIISVFPIITNATAGLTQVDRSLVDLFRVYDASRAAVVWRLRLPHAIPNIVTGAKISSGLSVIGAIVGEFFAGFGSSYHGLGYIIILTSGQLKTGELFAAIFTSTLLGLLIFGVVSLTGDALVSKWRDS